MVCPISGSTESVQPSPSRRGYPGSSLQLSPGQRLSNGAGLGSVLLRPCRRGCPGRSPPRLRQGPAVPAGPLPRGCRCRCSAPSTAPTPSPQRTARPGFRWPGDPQHARRPPSSALASLPESSAARPTECLQPQPCDLPTGTGHPWPEPSALPASTGCSRPEPFAVCTGTVCPQPEPFAPDTEPSAGHQSPDGSPGAPSLRGLWIWSRPLLSAPAAFHRAGSDRSFPFPPIVGLDFGAGPCS